jgi:hypothetical protein
MSTPKTIATEIGTAGEPAALTDQDLDAVTGGGVVQQHTAAILSTNGGADTTRSFPTETVKMTYGAIEWTY